MALRINGSSLILTLCWLCAALLVQIPYGIMADRYGRRPILFLGLLGIVLSTTWNMIVCKLSCFHRFTDFLPLLPWMICSDAASIVLRPSVFSIWYLLLGSIPMLIGGGWSVVAAMVWTILSDSIPPAKRTSLFYQLHAMMLILSATFRPVAAWLLSIDPWLPMWIGLGALVISMFSSLLIPETLYLHEMANEERRQVEDANGELRVDDEPFKSKHGVLQTAWGTTKKDFSRVWHLILGSKDIMLLIIAYGLCYPINIAFEMNMLQYVTNRFNWDWSTVSSYPLIITVVSILTVPHRRLILPPSPKLHQSSSLLYFCPWPLSCSPSATDWKT